MSILQHIYINQPFIMQLDTDTDLTLADTIKIRYKTPDGVISYKDAEPTYLGSKIIEAKFSGEENDQTGNWEFRSWVTFEGDDKPTPGTPFTIKIESVN